MSHCVFMHRSDSIYHDVPAYQYQFPRQYLSRALGSIGDWIVYLEPTKVRESRGYFAVARVTHIVADPTAKDMFLALIDPQSYLEFPQPVAFKAQGHVVERGLLNDSGRLSGRAQAAVRPVSDDDFARIYSLGMSENPLLPRVGTVEAPLGFADEAAPFVWDEPVERSRQLTSRLMRDRVFRKVVLRAYGERCAMTGLRLINGGGRAEVDAAHIKPVQANGPDSVNNGLALSGTAHWMFDRGLISLGDDLEILISRQANDIDGVRAFVNRSGFAHPPQSARDRPHPQFLKWHRENCFKQ